MANLEPTYGNFIAKGKVVGLGNDSAFRDGETGGGNNYKAVRFGVKTSNENVVYVELFGMEFDNATIWNRESKEKKSVHWAERYEDLPDGFELFMPTNIGLEKDDEGKNIKKQLLPYDAVDYIEKHLKDGDSVFVRGGNRFNEYKDETQVSHTIQHIYKAQDVDFEADDFEEICAFDQELVLIGSDRDKERNNLIVSTNIVANKDGDFYPYNFIIDIDEREKFAKNISKLAKKYGTVLKVEGYIHNRAKVEEVEAEEDDGWGDTPAGMQKNTFTNMIKELEITKADKNSVIEKKYKPEDFVVQTNEDTPFDEPEEDDAEWGDSDSETPFEEVDEDF